jgi:arylformamidase
MPLRSLTRRAALAGAATLAFAPQAGAQTSPTAPATPGPKVWLDMDQAALDAAYDQSKYAPNIAQVIKRYGLLSETTRQRLGAPQRFAYGSAPIEALDVFTTKRPNAPVHVFLHGGAWRAGSAKEYAFPAELFVNAGAHYVAVDFSAVQDHGGDLMPMADQVRRALVWLARNAGSFGGDPQQIYLSGHSSGAHLAGVALTTDWSGFGLSATPIKAALLISGLYDLRPARLSARSSYVRFTDESEQALSPQRYLDRLATPVIVAYGSQETPEFQRQSRDFAAAVTAAGKPARLLLAETYNHFEILETLANPYGLLGRAVLEQMRLTTA